MALASRTYQYSECVCWSEHRSHGAHRQHSTLNYALRLLHKSHYEHSAIQHLKRQQHVTEQLIWGLPLIKTCPTLQSKNIIVQRIPSQRMPCSLYLLRNASQFTPSYNEKNPEMRKKNFCFFMISKMLLSCSRLIVNNLFSTILRIFFFREDRCEFHHIKTLKKPTIIYW